MASLLVCTSLRCKSPRCRGLPQPCSMLCSSGCWRSCKISCSWYVPLCLLVSVVMYSVWALACCPFRDSILPERNTKINSKLKSSQIVHNLVQWSDCSYTAAHFLDIQIWNFLFRFNSFLDVQISIINSHLLDFWYSKINFSILCQSTFDFQISNYKMIFKYNLSKIFYKNYFIKFFLFWFLDIYFIFYCFVFCKRGTVQKFCICVYSMPKCWNNLVNPYSSFAKVLESCLYPH